MPGVLVAAVIVIVVRPLTGWVGLLGEPYSSSAKWTTAFFGIRGRGTISFLAHAVNEEFFPAAREVWAVAVLTILISIVVHGVTAGPVLHGLDRRRQRTSATNT